MKFFIHAQNAPEGQGTFTYLNGKVEGDPAVLEAANRIKVVQRTPHQGHQPMDWTDGELVGQTIQQAMSEVHGGPFRISVDHEDEPE
jgi:hypothetical protein